jgi:hypothetical protein
VSPIDSLTQMRVRLTHATTQVSPASLERIQQAWAGVPMKVERNLFGVGSVSVSQGEPGGFTAFMFHPWSPFSKGTATESMTQGKGQVREFFDLDPDDETVRFCQKKEFFIPKSKNELKIVLQTWHDLLKLLTVKGSVALDGLALILEQFDDHCEVIQEMFASSPDFGLTVLVILCNHLQKFFEMVSEMADVVTQASSRE